MRIAISSKSGCGNTTVTKMLSKRLGYPIDNSRPEEVADLLIATDDKTPEEIVEIIVENIRKKEGK